MQGGGWLWDHCSWIGYCCIALKRNDIAVQEATVMFFRNERKLSLTETWCEPAALKNHFKRCSKRCDEQMERLYFWLNAAEERKRVCKTFAIFSSRKLLTLNRSRNRHTRALSTIEWSSKIYAMPCWKQHEVGPYMPASTGCNGRSNAPVEIKIYLLWIGLLGEIRWSLKRETNCLLRQIYTIHDYEE